MAAVPALSWDQIETFKENFQNDKRNKLAQNATANNSPLKVCLDLDMVPERDHVFEYVVYPKAKPISHQKFTEVSGIHACLNMMRLPFMKKHKIEEFEFSQNYLLFWDKLERCHYFLKKFIETAHEPVESRLVQHLLANPMNNGAQWHMLANLIDKYGVVPKSSFPDAYSAEASQIMNDILNQMLRGDCLKLRKMVNEGATETELNEEVERMIEDVYRVISVCLGTPPEAVCLEYRDLDGKYCRLDCVTPLDFYTKYVMPDWNVQSKVCLVHDPRSKNPPRKLYSVAHLGNMVGGSPILHNNQPIDVLKKTAAESLMDGEAVWFCCDMRKQSHNKLGINDINIYDTELLFDVRMTMSKEERMIHGDSLMTHAMVLTGVTRKDGKEGEYLKWRAENSFGEEFGNNGYMVISDEWFSEYGFEVVVDKKYVQKDVLDVMEQRPITQLDPWDPMGALP